MSSAGTGGVTMPGVLSWVSMVKGAVSMVGDVASGFYPSEGEINEGSATNSKLKEASHALGADVSEVAALGLAAETAGQTLDKFLNSLIKFANLRNAALYEDDTAALQSFQEVGVSKEELGHDALSVLSQVGVSLASKSEQQAYHEGRQIGLGDQDVSFLREHSADNFKESFDEFQKQGEAYAHELQNLARAQAAYRQLLAVDQYKKNANLDPLLVAMEQWAGDLTTITQKSRNKDADELRANNGKLSREEFLPNIGDRAYARTMREMEMAQAGAAAIGSGVDAAGSAISDYSLSLIEKIRKEQEIQTQIMMDLLSLFSPTVKDFAASRNAVGGKSPSPDAETSPDGSQASPVSPETSSGTVDAAGVDASGHEAKGGMLPSSTGISADNPDGKGEMLPAAAIPVGGLNSRS